MQLFSNSSSKSSEEATSSAAAAASEDSSKSVNSDKSLGVLSSKLAGGPLGYGDPEDRTLRKVEIEVMVPKIIRERAKKEKCPQLKQDFDQCCLDNSFMMVVNCRGENRRYQECINRWFNDRTFVDECTEVYLAQRAEFRRTGIKQKLRAKNVK